MKTEDIMRLNKQFDTAKAEGQQIVNYSGYSVVLLRSGNHKNGLRRHHEPGTGQTADDCKTARSQEQGYGVSLVEVVVETLRKDELTPAQRQAKEHAEFMHAKGYVKCPDGWWQRATVAGWDKADTETLIGKMASGETEDPLVLKFFRAVGDKLEERAP